MARMRNTAEGLPELSDLLFEVRPFVPAPESLREEQPRMNMDEHQSKRVACSPGSGDPGLCR